MGDLLADLQSGDPSRQSGAVLAVLGAVATGRDAAPHVSAVCRLLLGGATAAPGPRRLAYDLALSAPLTDAGAFG